MHAHRCLCIRCATACGNNLRPERLGCTPVGASAFAAPQLAATTQGLRDWDARPQGPCTRSATAFVHQAGPATLSDIPLQRRQQAWQTADAARPARLGSTPSAASAFVEPQPSATTQGLNCATRMHTHRGSYIHGATAFSNNLNSRPARLGCTPSVASALEAPQPSSTGSAQRRSVTLHCGGDNRPFGDHLRHSVSPVGPATPRR